jgi:holo-[acyl-carrier protein] synthase
VIGIGNDLVDIERFRRALERTPSLRERVFTEAERSYADARSDPTERYAVRFAAKEAAMKALGVGLGEIALRDIEVQRGESGAPQLVLHGTAAELAEARGVRRWLITLSHSETVAQAIVVAL